MRPVHIWSGFVYTYSLPPVGRGDRLLINIPSCIIIYVLGIDFFSLLPYSLIFTKLVCNATATVGRMNYNRYDVINYLTSFYTNWLTRSWLIAFCILSIFISSTENFYTRIFLLDDILRIRSAWGIKTFTVFLEKKKKKKKKNVEWRYIDFRLLTLWPIDPRVE